MLRRTIGLLAILGACIVLVGSLRPAAANPQIKKLREQGNRAFNAGQFESALTKYREAFHLAERDVDMRLAGRVATNVGAAYLAMSRYQDALNWFLEGQRRAGQSHDSEGAGAAAVNLASLYYQVNDLEAADQAAQRALAATGNPFGMRSSLLIILGRIRAAQDRTEEAIHFFRQAIAVAAAKGDPHRTATAWQGLGEGLLQMKHPREAEQAFEHSRLIRPNQPVTYLWLSQTKLDEHDPRAASQLLEEAMALPPSSLTFDLWSIYKLRGEILLADKRPSEALEWFRKSIEATRIWSDDLVQNDAVRTSADKWFQQLYGPFIDTSISLSPDPHLEAFLAAEETRAASLRGTLTASRAFLTRVPPQYWETTKLLRSAETRWLATGSEEAKAQTEKLRADLSELEAKAGVPSLGTTRNKSTENITTINTLRYIQGSLTKEEALFSFYLGDKFSGLWAVTGGHFEFHQLPPKAQLSEQAKRFRRAVETGSPDRDELGKRLYAQLFGAVSLEIRAKPCWMISAADDLFSIPMAALTKERKHDRPVYLVEEHSIARVPSALMLRPQKAEAADGEFIGVADGIYNVADARYPRPAHSRFRFGFAWAERNPKPSIQLARLVGSGQEIQTCSRIWGGRKPAILLTGRQATRECFAAALRSHPGVIHVAAHVIAPQDNPEQASIDLGLSAQGEPEVMTYNDIYTLDVSGSTVVMNGCASAGAKAVSGAGVMGLTRAWMLAGARTVIGARWPIPDDTGVLFESFYFNWKENCDKGPRRTVIAKALQQAQLALLRSTTWRSDPQYWSAFYVVGKD